MEKNRLLSFLLFVSFDRKSYLSALLQGVTFAFSQCIIYFAYAAAFRFGGWLVETGKTEFDDVFL